MRSKTLKINRVFCDACGKDTTDDDNALLECSILVPWAEWDRSVDLCADCARKLTQYVIDFLPKVSPSWTDTYLVGTKGE